ncbi:MAG: hypothetical protein BMS9Abin28_0746 [Anaerolineae bacterium]|nr:MAG: hypothetical protein BMS9Abin28_0746 [Anaerolineae bacterium]
MMYKERASGGRRIVFMSRLVGVLFLFTLSACSFSSQDAVTPTPSSEQVLQTAQAIAQATIDSVTPTPTLAPPTDTPGPPTETFTPEPTGTPSTPVVTADYNANVRAGPGEEYEGLDFFLAGEQANVAGRYDDTPIGTWWFIRRIGDGRDGWVWSGAATLSGSEAGIPVLEPPPTPTPTEEPTGPPPTPSETPTATATP